MKHSRVYDQVADVVNPLVLLCLPSGTFREYNQVPQHLSPYPQAVGPGTRLTCVKGAAETDDRKTWNGMLLIGDATGECTS